MTKVGLVQINASFSGQSYLPYSVGILQAYAQSRLARPGDYEFLPPVFSRMPVERAVERLLPADIAFFSLYVWNARLSLLIAEAFKKRRPSALVCVGGPQVPEEAESFLRGNPFVDLACHGEGERTFLSLLEGASAGRLGVIPSTSRLVGGRVERPPRAERLSELDSIPSPYLAGVFEPLMAENPGRQWIATWETNRGCPFSCAFCDWGSAVASRVHAWDAGRLQAEIDWFARHRVEFVFCADANFGLLARDLELARALADAKARHGYPRAVSIQSAKNAPARAYEAQKVLSDAGLSKGAVVSLQSLDRRTLRAIKRDNIKLEAFHDIQRRFAADGVETVSDLILGLPEETYDSFTRGVAALIDHGQHNRIQFNNLSILPNAEMADPAYQARHGMRVIECPVVNVHGEFLPGELYETQRLVVGTTSMPPADWARARAFAWMASLLYFDKLLQLPLALARGAGGMDLRGLIELFCEGLSPGRFPVIAKTAEGFREKALDIQRGGMEFRHAPRWLDIWWPADEYALIELCVEGKLGAFYAEAARALAGALPPGNPLPTDALAQAVRANQELLKQPFQSGRFRLELDYDLPEYHRAYLLGRPIPLRRRPAVLEIDRDAEGWRSWDEWFRKVVWYGNKKGAYLYNSAPVESHGHLAGHF